MALREDCARQVSRNTRGRDRRNACDHQGWHSPLQLSGRSRRRAQKQPRALLRHHETTERRYGDEQGACNQVRAARRADARGISSPLTDCFSLDPPLPCQTGKHRSWKSKKDLVMSIPARTTVAMGLLSTLWLITGVSAAEELEGPEIKKLIAGETVRLNTPFG